MWADVSIQGDALRLTHFFVCAHWLWWIRIDWSESDAFRFHVDCRNFNQLHLCKWIWSRLCEWGDTSNELQSIPSPAKNIVSIVANRSNINKMSNGKRTTMNFSVAIVIFVANTNSKAIYCARFLSSSSNSSNIQHINVCIMYLSDSLWHHGSLRSKHFPNPNC